MQWRALGPLEIIGARAPVELTAAKERAVATVLALEAGSVVPAEILAEVLWGEDLPRSSTKTVQGYVFRIRKAVGAEMVARKGNGYVLAVDRAEVDARLFEQAAGRARACSRRGDAAGAAAAWTEALDLWRGGPELPHTPRGLALTAGWEEAYLAALTERIDAELALGRHAQLVGQLEGLVGVHPLVERLWGQLMVALYRSGRQADALRAYSRLRRLLGEELGLNPGSALQDLERAILAQDDRLLHDEVRLLHAARHSGKVAATRGDRAVEDLPQRPVLPSAGLPSGVVTFLLTDVADSTRLWQQAPEEMAQALERHDDIIRSAVESHGGVMVKTRGEGDSTFNVFAKASDAAAAAVEAQAALRAEEWPPSCRLVVRMAIHTGEAIQREADYFGTTVNRAARIRAIAEGGETLVSTPAAAVISDQVPQDTRLVEVGRPQLKDLQGRETIHLLQLADADGGFSLPRSLGLVEHNLPQQMTTFVGRTNEIAEIAGLLDRCRLVTLTGAGGAGKSRLAVKTAWTKVERFDDGVWLVELAPLDDPLLVGLSVAAVMSILEQPGRPILETLTGGLRGRRVLIILDNCEHLIDGAAKVTEAILRDCSEVKVLATSREPLRIEGELVYRVPPLSLPTDDAPAEALASSEAVRLFLERAGAARPGLGIDDPTIAAIGSICRRLDGMPLAIELAAARVSVLSIADIEARLDHRFGLLTTGARTALPRHQTLQALIDWSYDLLSEAEQAVLRRLSAFAGGFTLEAAEAVCGIDDVESSEVFGLVASLVNKSLVQFEQDEEPIRYRLLETIRAHAATKLARSGESNDVGDRHVKWFIDLAERAEGQLGGPSAKLWLDILEADHDNLRAALRIAAEESHGNEGLRLAGALGRFWEVRGHFSEGRGWLRALLATSTDAPASIRIRALLAAIRMAARLHEEQDARITAEECLAVSQDVGDQWGIARSLNALGLVATDQGDYEQARARYESSLAIGGAIGDRHIMADTICNLGLLAMLCGDALGARQTLEQSRALQDELGDARGMAYSLNFLGYLACDYGDYDEALARHKQSLRIRRELADKLGIRDSLNNVGHTYLLTGDFVRARRYLEESLALQRELGCTSAGGWALIDGIEWTLSDLGELSTAEGDLSGARFLLEQSLVRSNEACRMITLIRLGNVAAKELDFAQSDELHREALTLAKKTSDLVRLVACLEGLATTARLKGRWRRSATLFGAASAIRESIQAPLPLYQRRDHDNDVSTLRGHLGDSAFESAFSEGQALDRDEAVEYALRPEQLRTNPSGGRAGVSDEE